MSIFSILESKRFRASAAVIITMIITALFRDTEDISETLQDNIEWIMLVIFGGYSVTDIARMWLGREGSIEIASSGVQAAFDEFEDSTGRDISDNLEEVIVAGVAAMLADYAKDPV